MSSLARGVFIVIEGLDRSGKSTQVARLVDRIQSATTDASSSGSTPRAVPLKFPDRTTAIGKMIDAYLRSESDLDDHAIHLLFSANRWELAPKIEALLASGTTIVADRYAFSGIAFSAQKSPHLNLTFEWCKAPEIGLPAPDLTLFLDVKPEIAMQRGGYGEERYEKQEVQTRVRQVFERIGEEIGADRWVVIDAGQDRDKVGDDIWNRVVPVLRDTHKPVTRLWHGQEELR
ncbi:thymidylate kinase [Boletus reticuloceps]|uniref:Thymidylate kinase n=1 Tax=Boletus reticuloceps TaxID=495285 RepID=A0A8I2YPU0_9AGAM|nr:thymidylate kinase [Boletus reticuloceps]